MENEDMIPVHLVCSSHHVELTFIHALHDSGLISIRAFDEVQYVPREELKDLEKMIRLHDELEVNTEGIEVIMELLRKVESLQDMLRSMQNRLHRYEEDELL